MEASQGPARTPGAPNSTGAGIGTVSGHPPQTHENQAPEATPMFPGLGDSQNQPLGASEKLENDLQAALQAQLTHQPPTTSPNEALATGLTGAESTPISDPKEIADPNSTGILRQKRVRQDSQGEGAYTSIATPIQDYVIGALEPLQAR